MSGESGGLVLIQLILDSDMTRVSNSGLSLQNRFKELCMRDDGV